MTLLSVVRDHCQLHALATPTTVIGNSDTTVLQLLAIMNQLAEEIPDQSKFQGFTAQALFTCIAGEDQGPMTTLAPGSMGWFNNETFYDRTLCRPLYGPVTDEEWQALKAIPNPGPWYKYRIWKDHLYINPAPAVAPFSEIAFEYQTKYAVRAADDTPKEKFTVDTDYFGLPEKIIKRGLSFRWKQIKGLPYQADETAYYDLLSNAISRDGTARQYNMANNRPESMIPGIFVPSGNWPVHN